jgi:acyl transferase domain-containing protein/NAD(P)-dependent dehydrogenase (short-subunit alcohol dehydrogenase family)
LNENHKNKIQQVPVAVVGMECFFPKSSGLKEYWRLIFRAQDGISDIPPAHWSPEDYYHEDPKKPDHVYCKRGGFLDPISFNPAEFGIPPAILDATDSSQLLALMAAKAALADAGYDGKAKSCDKENTSVILGVTGTQELVIPLSSRLGHPVWRKALKESGVSDEVIEEVVHRISGAYVSWQENSFPGLLGNVVAGRICNRLDLGGTNCVVDAACASSLGAVHMAMMELITGRSNMVVTGGVDTLNDIFMHMCFSKTGVLSATGDARPFSKDADGTVLGEGIGILILKRLEDAEKDHDRIYAVIKAMGTSSDGKSQSIYAPGAEGQIRALADAYSLAEVSPSSVELIEAHGTGTRVGDLVEFSALKGFFSNAGNKENVSIPCALGSVKSMIGHTKAAAGAAGLIKGVLALYNKVLPPTLKAKDPDPDLGIESTRFYLSDQSRPWFSRTEHPRRAGISAFGFGGSNFHAVLEEHSKVKNHTSWDGSVEILAFSEDTVDAIIRSLQSLRAAASSAKSFKEISGLAGASRLKFNQSQAFRLLMVVEHTIWQKESAAGILKILEDAVLKLSENPEAPQLDAKTTFFGGPIKPGKIAFVFPGQGAQYVDMGLDLVCTFPDAFKVLETANSLFPQPTRLSDIIYPVPVVDKKLKKQQEEDLTQTDVAQPAIGSISLAMLKIIQSFGLKPDAACGHSFGELVALNAAGWMDDSTLIHLAIHRGRLMALAGKAGGDPGTMLAVKAPLEALDELIRNSDTGVILANRNNPTQGVLSGPTEAIAKADQLCKEKGFKTVALSVAAAFHSHLMKGAQQPFMDIVNQSKLEPTDIQVFANSTGAPYPSDSQGAKKILGEQLIRHVDFVNDIRSLYASGIETFVEVGPKTVLSGLIKSILEGQLFNMVAVDGSGGRQSGMSDLAKALCQLAALGYPVLVGNWEPGSTPPADPDKPKMEIMISGTNYRASKNMSSDGEAKKKTTDPVKEKSMKKTNPEERQKMPGPVNRDANMETHVISKEDRLKKPDPGIALDARTLALSVVREGLKAMQALHHQTAETHRKFLDTQTEASRTLKAMLDSTRRWMYPNGSLPVDEPALIPAMEMTLAKPEHFGFTETEIQAISVPSQGSGPLEIEEKTSKNHDQGFAWHADIKNVLLNIVSELTGYPETMLGLDMDMESDLGIDSIKRVEILSTLEEKLPGLCQVEPEVMGTLKTLNQIIGYLSRKGSSSDIGQDQQTSSKEKISESLKALAGILLETVSELTGYPETMLGLDMDMESDLGIDSIKRVEILSTLEEKLPGLCQVEPEVMGSLKTLNQIIQYLSPDVPLPETDSGPSLIIEDLKPVSEPEGVQQENECRLARRHIVSLVSNPSQRQNSSSIPSGKKVYILNTNAQIVRNVLEELIHRNIPAICIQKDADMGRLDVSDAAGLILPAPGNKPSNHQEEAHFLEQSLMMAKTFARPLAESAKAGHAFFATVSSLDGAFGFSNLRISSPFMGALAGLAKTAALEWPGVICRAMDVAYQWPNPKDLSKAIVDEVLNSNPRGPVEIGLNPDQRYELALLPADYPEGEFRLSANDVVVVTGGARGVTAATTLALAETVPLSIVLLGRSEDPFEEPVWLKGLSHEREIKRAILENEMDFQQASPARLEKRYKTYAANREILSNLRAMETAGSKPRYYSVDIQDKEKVRQVLREVHDEIGPVSAILHGAGILEDKLIIDKTPEQFRKVFGTKVFGLLNLLDATRNDPLKYLILFSSVAARMGNKGQADYAMANEALNKLARKEFLDRKDCRVVSINWGPWDGGMVSSGLKKEFTKNGIDLIPLDQGAKSLLAEMKGNLNTPVEVVMGSMILDQNQPEPALEYPGEPLGMASCSGLNSKLSMAFQREIDTEEYPILKSHILGGIPVVPFALMTEWFSHGALHGNPGLVLQGLDDMRVLKGIRINGNRKNIRVLTGKVTRNNGVFEVDVEIRNGIPEEKEVIHSRARAILSDDLPPPPEFIEPAFMGSNGYSRSIREIYDKILFHGQELQGMKEVTTLTDDGMIARIQSAPHPNRWMKKPIRNKWVGDPLVLDSAFQMASLWCFEKLGRVSLPVYSEGYRQYREQFPENLITTVLEVTHAADHKMKGNFTFLDENRQVIATITGFEAVVDDSLKQAFKP